MRQVVLYIAMSLDGYVADEQGGVAWLAGDGSDSNHPGSYPEFIQTVDTVIMGYATYHQIVTELSPHEWAYPGKTSYVITHKHLPSTAEIIFTDQPMDDLITALKSKDGQDIWICGGASIVNQLIDSGQIDRFCITILPIILGRGIRLFADHERETPLRLISTRSYNGMTDLVYERKSRKRKKRHTLN